MRPKIVLFVLLVVLAACNQRTELQVPVTPLGEVEIAEVTLLPFAITDFTTDF